MARPRTVADEKILEAAMRIAARVGPHRMTLEEVGREVRLSAAAVLQRFGSKRELLLALVAKGPRDIDARFAMARAQMPDAPLDALAEAVAGDTRAFATPQDVAAGLSFLQLDLSDEEFRHLTRAHFDAMRRQARALLDEAVARGDLAAGDTGTLARMVEVVYNGAILSWAVHRDVDSAADALRRDLGALLDPHRTERQALKRRQKA